MVEQGFDYIPRTHPDIQPDSVGSLNSGIDRDLAEEFGYGLTTRWWEDERANALAASNYVDPNIEAIANWSEAEQKAFYTALQGPIIETVESGEGDGMMEIRDQAAGCEYQAEASLRGVDLQGLDDAILLAVQEVWALVGAHPEVIAVDEDWQRCMATEGFPIEREAPEIEGSIETIGGWYVTGEELALRLMDQLLSAASWTTETLTNDDGDQITIEVPVVDEAVLERAQDEEIQLALADIDCDEHTGRSATIERVRSEIEGGVIDKYFTALSEALIGE